VNLASTPPAHKVESLISGSLIKILSITRFLPRNAPMHATRSIHWKHEDKLHDRGRVCANGPQEALEGSSVLYCE
jgi:hypothetical protein